MKVALWSPLPPAPSGIADHVAESLPHLAPRCDLTVVVEDPATVDPGVARLVRVVSPDAVPPVDVDVYEIGNSPAHGYVYRTALVRPGVTVLHEWGLHELVLHETAGRGDPAAYVREMRRGHGEAGTFVARQVLRGLGGDTLPARFPANDQLLESSLAIVATTRFTAQQAARRLPGRPVTHLPLHVVAPASADRAAARRALGLPADALVVTAPGLATRSKRLDVAIRAVARVLGERPSVRLVVAGPREEGLPLEQWGAAAGLGDALVVTGRIAMADFERHLAAADVVLALRFPTRGEMSAALLRALAAGRPTLVTAGTPATQEFPEGVVIPVDPGVREEAELAGWIRVLADRPALGAAIGRQAAAFVRERHDAPALAAGLVRFLAGVAPGRAAFAQRLAAQRAHDGTRLGEFLVEVRSAARELGLVDLAPDPEGIAGLLAPLAGGGHP